MNKAAPRNQAQAALRQHAERFRALVEATSDWIWEVDAHGVYTYASPKVKDLLGYTPKEVVGRTPFDFMPPKEAKLIKAEFARIARKGRPFARLENVNQRKNGQRVVLETSGVPILASDGTLQGWRGVDRDITERKQAQEALARTAQEWATTFDAISDFVSMHDRDFRLIRANKAFADAFKMKPEDLVGRKCYAIIHGSKKPPPNCPHSRVLKTKSPSQAEIFEPRLGLHLEVSASPIFDQEGNLSGSVHIAKDITARRQAEESLAAEKEWLAVTLKHIGDGVIATDTDGHVILLNKVAEKLTGWTQ